MALVPFTPAEIDFINDKIWKYSVENTPANKTVFKAIIEKIQKTEADTGGNIEFVSGWAFNQEKELQKFTTKFQKIFLPQVNTIIQVIGEKEQPKEINIRKFEKQFTNKNLYKLKNSIPFFRKSYSTLSSYTPLIKCFIKIKNLFSENKEEKYIFDIPYNYIKSLRVESTTSDSLTSKLTLTLEDPIGSVATIMVATLHLLGLDGKSNLPKINIEFGWGGNQTRSAFNKNNKNVLPHFKTTLTKTYLIEKSEITYENLKQRVVLTCSQDLTSIDEILKEKNPISVLKTTNLASLLVINRTTTYIKQQNYTDKTLANLISEPNISNPFYEKNGINYTLNPFNDKIYNKKLYGDVFGSKTPARKNPYLFAFGLTSNDLYNTDINLIPKQELNFFNSFAPMWNRAKFHPYNVFCFILNRFLYQLSLEETSPEIIIFPLFEESKIIGINGGVYLQKLESNGSYPDIYGSNYTNIFTNTIQNKTNINESIIYKSFKVVGKDIDKYILTKEKKEFGSLGVTDLEFNESSSWISLLNNFANKVKLYADDKKTNETELLSINFELIESNQNDEKNKQKYNKINNIIELILKKNNPNNNNENSKKYIKEIKEKLDSKNKILLIFIGANSNIFSLKNKPMQKYTIFPNVKPPIKPNSQFFNSGSKNLLDGSFPDVISFQPQLDFSKAIASTIAQRNFIPKMNEKNTSIEDDKFKIYLANSKQYDENEIINYFNFLYKKLQDVLYSDVVIEFKRNSDTDFIYDTTQPDFYFTCDTIKRNLNSITRSYFFPKSTQNDDSDTITKKAIIKGIIDDYEKHVAKKNIDSFTSITRNIFVKSIGAFPGDRSSSSYMSFLNKSNDFFRTLKRSAYNFDAELKILGEPAFSYLWGSQPFLFIEVNNPDGSPNILLSGVYMVMSFTHEIDGGKFTTTLKLKYDSPYVENFAINDKFQTIVGK